MTDEYRSDRVVESIIWNKNFNSTIVAQVIQIPPDEEANPPIGVHIIETKEYDLILCCCASDFGNIVDKLNC